MVRLAVADNPSFNVDDREVRRPGSTYTVDTLEELAREGFRQPYLILGADAFADLPNWHRHEELPKLARIVIAPRPGIEPPPGYPVLDMPAIAISSTDIRRRLHAGLPIRYLVPDPVISYIHHHRLYT
jgi:nicotinate-nucleotide adenylyltransferase